MSVLETPRIVFAGEISWDPIVTNNYQQFYDEDTAWTVFEKQESVEQFRQSVITKEAVYNGNHLLNPSDPNSGGLGNWNPQGTHRSVMYDTYVSGVDLGDGVVDDPFVGGPVDFKGMLVDCEPYGAYSSQLFFDHLALGIKGSCRISAPRSNRMTARYINFFRLPSSVYGFAASVASVNWQTAFSKDDGLQIDAHDSPALQALSAALQDDDVLGITVRFNAYSTHYYGAAESSEIDSRETELVAKLAGGGFQPNPARSHITGVVGLWRKGEPIHEPGDRALIAAQNGPPNYIATAHARLSDASISLDFSNCISETDLNLSKQNLGTLVLNAADSSGATTKLADIPYSLYDKEAYDKNSGIIRLPLTIAQQSAAASGSLSLTGSDGTHYLKEEALRAIPCEPNFYINFGDATTTDVMVLDKGKPAASGLTVAMADPNSSIRSEATTDANGVATFDVFGQQGQVQGFVFTPNPVGLGPQAISTQVTTYMYVRTLPGNDAIAELAPTWDNVYKYCLANWNAMAPCMDNWLDLKDPVQVKAYASVIKRLTDPANFESFLYMPVTRDMTDKERKLLYDFLDGVDSDAPSLKEGSETQKQTDHDALSQDMRRA